MKKDELKEKSLDIMVTRLTGYFPNPEKDLDNIEFCKLVNLFRVAKTKQELVHAYKKYIMYGMINFDSEVDLPVQVYACFRENRNHNERCGFKEADLLKLFYTEDYDIDLSLCTDEPKGKQPEGDKKEQVESEATSEDISKKPRNIQKELGKDQDVQHKNNGKVVEEKPEAAEAIQKNKEKMVEQKQPAVQPQTHKAATTAVNAMAANTVKQFDINNFTARKAASGGDCRYGMLAELEDQVTYPTGVARSFQQPNNHQHAHELLPVQIAEANGTSPDAMWAEVRKHVNFHIREEISIDEMAGLFDLVHDKRLKEAMKKLGCKYRANNPLLDEISLDAVAQDNQAIKQWYNMAFTMPLAKDSKNKIIVLYNTTPVPNGACGCLQHPINIFTGEI